jgi:hypothetical protein
MVALALASILDLLRDVIVAALNQHLLSLVHNVTQFHCSDCDRDLINETALVQLLRDKVHKLIGDKRK